MISEIDKQKYPFFNFIEVEGFKNPSALIKEDFKAPGQFTNFNLELIRVYNKKSESARYTYQCYDLDHDGKGYIKYNNGASKDYIDEVSFGSLIISYQKDLGYFLNNKKPQVSLNYTVRGRYVCKRKDNGYVFYLQVFFNSNPVVFRSFVLDHNILNYIKQCVLCKYISKPDVIMIDSLDEDDASSGLVFD